MRSFLCILIVGFLAFSALGVASAQEYENLQVLPQDVSPDELSQAMLENLRGLGLPRRQNEGCLHCHVGDMERVSDTWDWASDAKPEKVKARAMMVMVNEINREHLAKLEFRGVARAAPRPCHGTAPSRDAPEPAVELGPLPPIR